MVSLARVLSCLLVVGVAFSPLVSLAVVGSTSVYAQAPSESADPSTDHGIASDVHDILDGRRTGGIGDDVSDLARDQRPRPRH